MRRIIAALQVSVDGFFKGPNGELDWAMAEDEELWDEVFETLESVDTCLLGRAIYPDYERYWLAVLADPTGPLPLSGETATKKTVTRPGSGVETTEGRLLVGFGGVDSGSASQPADLLRSRAAHGHFVPALHRHLEA